MNLKDLLIEEFLTYSKSYLVQQKNKPITFPIYKNPNKRDYEELFKEQNEMLKNETKSIKFFVKPMFKFVVDEKNKNVYIAPALVTHYDIAKSLKNIVTSNLTNGIGKKSGSFFKLIYTSSLNYSVPKWAKKYLGQK